MNFHILTLYIIYYKKKSDKAGIYGTIGVIVIWRLNQRPIMVAPPNLKVGVNQYLT